MAEAGKGKRIAVWVISGLLAVLFAVMAGLPKLSGSAQAVEGFAHYGYSDGFRVFIGAAEVAGGIGLLIPAVAAWAVAGLLIIMAGAVYTLLSHGETAQAAIPLVVAGLLLVVGAWRRGQALFLSRGA